MPQSELEQKDEYQPLQITDLYPKPKKLKKYLIRIPLLIILLAGLGFGGYTWLHKKPVPKPAPQPATPTTAQKDVPDAKGTKVYESGLLAVKLTYPDTWKATESADRTSVRLESPDFSYQSSAKGTVSGDFRISIRMGARDIDDKYIGRGYAMQPSDKLTYSAPAAGQRPDTYLSLFGLDTPNNFAFFLIAGNYNLKQGDSLGPSYGKEAETYIISGGFASKDLADDLATNPVAPALVKTSNAYKQAVDILTSLQLR